MSTSTENHGMWKMVVLGLTIILVVAGVVSLIPRPAERVVPASAPVQWEIDSRLKGKLHISDCGPIGATLNCVVRNNSDVQLFDYHPSQAYTITCFDSTNLKLRETHMNPVEARTAERQDLCPLQGLVRIRIKKEMS